MHRVLLLALLSACGGDPACDANQYCTSGAHYNFCNAGSGGCYYSGSDGSRFACRSCGDCATALAAVESWCQGAPAGSNDHPDPVQSCTPAPACGNGTYQFCSGGNHCFYALSDQTRIDCVSCSDCIDASKQVETWCDPLASDSLCQNSDQNACITCCGKNHPAGAQKALELGKACFCQGCPDCADAPVCGGMSSTVSSACATCMSSSATKSCFAAAQSQCDADQACNLYHLCALGVCGVM